jgi:hypothetical protein
MAKTRQVYIAEDGKEFDTEAECNAHDAGLANSAVIEAYITHAKLEKAQAGLMRKHIAGYIAFAASGAAQSVDMFDKGGDDGQA